MIVGESLVLVLKRYFVGFVKKEKMWFFRNWFDVIIINIKQGCTENGSLSKEDAAYICIEAVDVVPERGLVFEVVNGEEKVLNWKDQFERLMKQA